MTLAIEEIVLLPDPVVILDRVDRYLATQLIRALRKSSAHDPHKRISYRLAEVLHQRHPDDIVVTTVFTAVLKDVGELNRAATILAERLREDCDSYILRVVGSVLWRKDMRTSAQFAFDLADHFDDVGRENVHITVETLTTLKDRLRGTWLPGNPFFNAAESCQATELPSEELMLLETSVVVAGLHGFTIRPLKSKRQLARVANQLKNCLNSYLSQVLNGTTLLFAVELNGTPIEAIEINPASKRIVQWKGFRNSAPNSKTQPYIKKALAGL